MNIGIPAETRAGETRVAATPETVKKLAAGGRHAILAQSGAGAAASAPDRGFQAARAKNGPGAEELCGAAHRLNGRGPEDGGGGPFKPGPIPLGVPDPRR